VLVSQTTGVLRGARRAPMKLSGWNGTSFVVRLPQNFERTGAVLRQFLEQARALAPVQGDVL
jgi:hypothetical protein